ncbi:CPBP family intramembrane metalloprotease [Alkalicella caledoniensis]|uniref:CPBP family intramembrane metalloprotease n=1 Tax=Alkalicella caledoniensis TaxID=2731377 RepID=A0A7G9WB04_ALKCA|nr:CPBP family intramembrane glutamic endopeptidase [Alkalicella caledoniensis]QNO15866.1 CPBP family intramembrane metalloprotease [Alkalicella caledoniensis]
MPKTERYVPVKGNTEIVKTSEKMYIVLFIMLALLSGWIGLLIDMVLPEQLEEQTLGMGIWLVLPFLCGIAIRAFRKDWKDLGIKPRFKQNVKWFGLAILFFPAITLLFTLLAWILGLVSFSSFSAASIIPSIASMFIALIIKNIFEDFAWQGYLTPKLAAVKINDFKLYLIVGLVWAFWHAPYYLYFLPDSMYSTPLDRILDALVKSPIIITIWAVIFVEMTRITRSVWPAVLMHTFEDLIPNFLILEEKIIEFKGVGNILFNPLTGIIPLAACLAFGLWLRRKRIDRDELLI